MALDYTRPTAYVSILVDWHEPTLPIRCLWPEQNHFNSPSFKPLPEIELRQTNTLYPRSYNVSSLGGDQRTEMYVSIAIWAFPKAFDHGLFRRWHHRMCVSVESEDRDNGSFKIRRLSNRTTSEMLIVPHERWISSLLVSSVWLPLRRTQSRTTETHLNFQTNGN